MGEPCSQVGQQLHRCPTNRSVGRNAKRRARPTKAGTKNDVFSPTKTLHCQNENCWRGIALISNKQIQLPCTY